VKGPRELWPDPDRRHDSLIRLASRVIATPGGLPGEPVTLTPEQRHCLSASAAGLHLNEAAEALGLGPYTVQRHLLHARLLLTAKNPTHAVANALRLGLIP
jgi:DNA-binding CsgD family transcriptional regulator